MSDLFRIYFQDGSYRFCRWIRSDVKKRQTSQDDSKTFGMKRWESHGTIF